MVLLLLVLIWLFIGRLPWFYSTNYPALYSDQRLQITDRSYVAQSFYALYPGLHRVDIHFANSGKNTGRVIFQLRESCDSNSAWVQIEVGESEIEDNGYHRFDFDPLDGSAFREYCIVIEEHSGQPVEQVAVFASSTDIYPDGTGIFYQEETPGNENLPPSDFKPTHFIWLPAIFSQHGPRDFDIGFNLYYNGRTLDTFRALLIHLTKHKTLIFGSPWFYPVILLVYVIGVAVLLVIVWRRNENSPG
jgi:hypothetical protein